MITIILIYIIIYHKCKMCYISIVSLIIILIITDDIFVNRYEYELKILCSLGKYHLKTNKIYT